VRLGADPEQLEHLAGVHERCASELASVRHRVLRSRRCPWQGPAADAWRRQLDDTVLRAAAEAERSSAAAAQRLRAAVRDQRLASLPSPSWSTLRADRQGDGRWVGRLGDADARLVVVLVPGVGNDLSDVPALRAAAERVWTAAAVRAPSVGSRGPDGVAVVGWLGYDPPDHLLAAVGAGPAVEGGRALVESVHELRRQGAERVVVVGHSYGALVAARASSAGMRPDELVVLGAPGLGVADTNALALPPGTDLWSAAATGDPVVAVARAGVVHGPDPGPLARPLPTSRRGHSAYLDDPVLLDALASVALGER
jgi:hypothetical protein